MPVGFLEEDGKLIVVAEDGLAALESSTPALVEITLE